MSAFFFCTLQAVRSPSRFVVPLFPATSMLGILFTIHLLCSLGWPAYVRFVVWMVLGAVVYVFYGAGSADVHESEEKLTPRAREGVGAVGKDEADTVELIERERTVLMGDDGDE